MVKVSITFADATQITLESEEPEVILQVLSVALRDLPRELMHSSAGSVPDSPQADKPQGSGGVKRDAKDRASERRSLNAFQKAGVSIVETAGLPPKVQSAAEQLPAEQLIESGTLEPQADTASGLASSPPAATPGRARTSRSATPTPARTDREPVSWKPGDGGTGGTRSATTGAHQQFAQFCASAAPLGDMRKVVVAAEGARRFLSMPSVDATDLAGLFDLAGWRTPHNFTQTLRNAARDKYRWLQSVPGRSGRYAATQLGRTTTMTE